MPPETLADLALAAEQRFRDAEELLVADRFAGAVYLCGLASEMWLKFACFKFLGAGPASPVAGLLGPAKAWMTAFAPAVSPESFHSLAFWVQYFVGRRIAEGKPLSSDASGRLRHHAANRLFQDWKIELRYRPLVISDRHAWRVYNDTAWVRRSWNELWR